VQRSRKWGIEAAAEQEKLTSGTWNYENATSQGKTNTKSDEKEPTPDLMDFEVEDEETFSQFAQRIDDMFRQTTDGIKQHDEDDEDNIDLPVDELDDLPSLPDNYMPMSNKPAGEKMNENIFPAPAVETPQVDALNNPYVRVVDINGVHHIGLVYCTCRGKETTHADLMAAGLVPTSFTRYKTIFTHAVLDDFRLANLECKASAYQYFQKIRRHTSPMFPDSVPNLYHELRRMSRIWRWMKKLKWAGMAHRHIFTTDPKPGELANFCPTCPQPGINLPDNWVQDFKR
jgi:hypothetical protein